MKKNNLIKAVFLQARLESSRLPGKLFLKLSNKSILRHIIERLLTLKKIINYIVIVAPFSDVKIIQSHIKSYPSVIVFGGDNENVLKRFYDANKKIDADIIIRATADNPLVDLIHLKKCLISHIKYENDYTIPQDLPLGCGTEVISKFALTEAFTSADKPYQKEHVTPFIREHKERFKIMKIKPIPFFQHPDWRLTVDEKEDYELLKIIYNNLYKGKPIPLRTVINFLNKNPELIKINKHIKQVIVP